MKLLGVFAFLLPTLAVGHNLGKIHCIGDSLTLGTGSSAGTGGYRRPLSDALTARGYAHSFVGSLATWPGGSWPQGRHDGRGGWTTLDLLNGRNGQAGAPTWLASFQPETVLLLCGRNDPGDWSQSYEQYSALANAVFAARPNATVYWSNVFLPLDQGFWSRYQCETQDTALRQVVMEQKAMGRKVWYVDSYRKLAGRTDIFSDAVHLNDTGYRLLADVWLRAIVKTPRL